MLRPPSLNMPTSRNARCSSEAARRRRDTGTRRADAEGRSDVLLGCPGAIAAFPRAQPLSPSRLRRHTRIVGFEDGISKHSHGLAGRLGDLRSPAAAPPALMPTASSQSRDPQSKAQTVSFRFLRNSPIEGGSSRETAGAVTVALHPSLITFAFDLALSLRSRLRQRPKRQVLQCSLRHDQQSLCPKLIRHRPQQHLAQSGCLWPVLASASLTAPGAAWQSLLLWAGARPAVRRRGGPLSRSRPA